MNTQHFSKKLIYTNGFNRAFALTFLFCIISEIGYPTIKLFANKKNASIAFSGNGAQPISDIADSFVDLYTGDFKYGIPLLSVPGPNGENVSVSANYAAGIRMNQKASWLGLGWDYNPGEISRSVVGYPDDYNGEPVFNTSNGACVLPSAGLTPYTNPVFNSLRPFKKTLAYGTFYYNNINTTSANPYFLLGSSNSDNPWVNSNVEKTLDLFTSEVTYNSNDIQSLAYANSVQSGGAFYSNYYNPSSSANRNPTFFSQFAAPYSLPAYDQYFVSGPGIGGKIKPQYLSQWTNLINKKAETYSSVSTVTAGTTQFYFDQSIDKTRNGLYPADGANNRIKSGYFVKYCTNANLNTSSNLYSNLSKQGFLDYKVITGSTRRASSDFPQSGIGAIQITDPNGVTYHYSLPIYNFNETQRFFKNAPGSDDLHLKPSSINSNGDATGISFDMAIRKEKYAQTWKLTAITGPDFLDKNGNKVADEGDGGYWVAYEYGKYSDEFLYASNYFNYGQYQSTKINPLNMCRSYVGYRKSAFGKEFNTFIGSKQLYYLDKIKTSTHTAYFVKNYRNDNISYDNVFHKNTPTTSVPDNKPKPELRLSRIILLRNEDKNLIENSQSTTPGAFNANFNSTGTNINSLINEAKYLSNKSAIDAKSLKSVILKSDYSLCRKLYDNITNSFIYANVGSNSGVSGYYTIFNSNSPFIISLYDKQSSRYTSSNYASQSGKLTLNEIEILEDGAEKIIPSFKFDYNISNSNDNPDYDPEKVDMWGFYKSDFTNMDNSNYTTATSSQNTDAWSLRSVSLPTGSKITVDYESDEYECEGFNDEPFIDNQMASVPFNASSNDPSLIYPIHKSSVEFYYAGNLANAGDYTFLYNDYDNIIGDNQTGGNLKCQRLFVPCRETCNLGQKYQYGFYDYLVNFNGFFSASTILSANSVNTSLSSNYNYITVDKKLGILPSDYSNYPLTTPPGFQQPASPDPLCLPTNQPNKVYDRNYGYGFALVKFNKLYGGGIRVKTIGISDNAGTENYKKSYTYKEGYCPVPSKPFMLGPQINYSSLNLLLNSYAYFPYANLSNVGYTTVESSNIDLNGNTNGKKVYTFKNNDKTAAGLKIGIPKPIFASVSLYPSIYYMTNCNANPGGGSCNPFVRPQKRSYQVDIQFNDENVLLLGKLLQVRSFNSNNVEMANTKYTYKNSTYIQEDFGLPEFAYSHQINYSTPCTSGTPANVSCYHQEDYAYVSHLINKNVLLKSVETLVDGIKTVKEMEYDPDTRDMFKTTLTTGGEVITTQKTYAYNNSAVYQNNDPNSLISSNMGFKALNEINRNQVLVPYITKTTKRRDFSGSQEYLISEEKHLTALRINKISPFANAAINMQLGGYNSVSGIHIDPNTNYSSSDPNVYYPGTTSYNRLLDDNTFSNSTATPVYELGTQITAINNNNGQVIETQTKTGRYTASKYCNNFENVLTSIADARYGSFTYCNFEDEYTFYSPSSLKMFDGDVNAPNLKSAAVLITSPTPILIKPHTGNYMVKVPATNSSISPSNAPTFVTKEFEVGRTYTAKVWVHANSPSTCKLFAKYSLNGGASVYKDIAKNDPSNVAVGNWILMNLEFTIPETTSLTNNILQVGLLNPATGSAGDAYFDDFTFHPVDAEVGGNVYDKRTNRIIATLDNENYATLYNYDAAGRVISIYKESKQFSKFIKVADTEYHNCQTGLYLTPGASPN